MSDWETDTSSGQQKTYGATGGAKYDKMDSSRNSKSETILLLEPSADVRSPRYQFQAKGKMATLLSQITWSRFKVLVVLIILIIMILLFSTEAEAGETLNLGAADLDSPLIIEILDPPPIEVLDVHMHAQPEQADGRNSTWVYVNLQKLDQEQWTTVDSTEVKLGVDELLLHHTFKVLEEKPYSSWRFNISTNNRAPIGVTFEVRYLPAIALYEVLFASLILCGVYILIVFELVHRTIAALLGSFVGLAVYSKLHSRPALPVIISWIDFETCGLLFGMMVMVGIFSQTGFFEWAAVKAYKFSRGNVWKLVTILCIFTAIISAFLDNVTTILLLTPVTIRLCKVLEIPPQQILIALVLFSNIGGTATAIGDPPNILIVSDARIKRTGLITFGSFLLHMTPGVLISCVVGYFVIKALSKGKFQREPNMNRKKEVDIWRRTLKKLREDNEEERVVKRKLEQYIADLEQKIQSTATPAALDITELENKYTIHDKTLFINSCLILAVVIILFFLHSAIHLHLSLAWIAIIGAMAHLLISGIKDIDEVLEKVEFGTLLFFAGLFILMRTLEELGLVDFIGEKTSTAIAQVPEGNTRLTVAIILIIWVSALVSAFIDNIPYTAAMIPVVVTLGNGELGLPLSPLIWALSFGTCFGGNGTLIGASANVVAAGISESQGHPISFNTFFRTGFPVTLVTVFTATVYMLIFHVLIAWY